MGGIGLGLTASYEDLVGAILVTELGSVALTRFLLRLGLDSKNGEIDMRTHEFNGNLSVVQQVGTFEDDTKRTLANLLADAVMHADDVGR